MSVLHSLHNRVPLHVRRLVNPLANYVRHLRMELWSVTGEELHSRLPLSVLCAVPSEDRNYILSLIFGGSFEQRRLGPVWSTNLSKSIGDHAANHSMVLLGARRSQTQSMAAQGFFVIPSWVDGEVSLPLDPEVLNSRSVRSDFKKIAEHKLTYEVTTELGYFEKFYREMHIPYTRMAHGENAHIESYKIFRQKLRDWDLVLVKGETGYIAGQLITYEHAKPRFYLVGVKDGNREFVKQRALGAAYQFSFQHVVERGFPRAGLGFSRAFLKDGVLRYKQKLSQRIIGSSGAGIALKILSYTPAAESFLQNNPFIFRSEEGLAGAVFADAGKQLSQKEERELNRDYFHPGLTRLSTYHFPEAGVSCEPKSSESLAYASELRRF